MKTVQILALSLALMILVSCNSTEKSSTAETTTPEKATQRYSEHSPLAHHKVALEVLTASKAWITAFNAGKAETCVAGYTQDAVMHAQPFGVKHGGAAIDSFWTPFIASGATDLEYSNVTIEVVNETTVLLAADWRMNVGEGKIYEEKWVKKGDQWLLEYDNFQVLKQYDAPQQKDIQPLASHEALEQVIQASMTWTEGFNSGNGAVCEAGYTAEGIMYATPFAKLYEQKAIGGFWKKLIQDGATNLIYHCPKIQQVNGNVILLASDWSMNIGEGKIYQEKWVKDAGNWKLGYDEFEVLKQY